MYAKLLSSIRKPFLPSSSSSSFSFSSLYSPLSSPLSPSSSLSRFRPRRFPIPILISLSFVLICIILWAASSSSPSSSSSLYSFFRSSFFSSSSDSNHDASSGNDIKLNEKDKIPSANKLSWREEKEKKDEFPPMIQTHSPLIISLTDGAKNQYHKININDKSASKSGGDNTPLPSSLSWCDLSSPHYSPFRPVSPHFKEKELSSSSSSSSSLPTDHPIKKSKSSSSSSSSSPPPSFSVPLPYRLHFIDNYKSIPTGGDNSPHFLAFFSVLSTLQRRIGVYGTIGEIGTDKGRTLIAMAITMTKGEKLFVCDSNYHAEGKAEEINDIGRFFLDNLSKFHISHEYLSIYPFKSSTLPTTLLHDLSLPPFRLLSIDGGTDRESVYSDILFAAKNLRDDGVICLNNFLHLKWLSVMEGMMTYLLNGEIPLSPFLFGMGHLCLSRPQFHSFYYESILKYPIWGGWMQSVNSPDGEWTMTLGGYNMLLMSHYVGEGEERLANMWKSEVAVI